MIMGKFIEKLNKWVDKLCDLRDRMLDFISDTDTDPSKILNNPQNVYGNNDAFERGHNLMKENWKNM